MDLDVRVNGNKEAVSVTDGYITITKEWTKGDVVTLGLPMNIRKVKSNTSVQDNTNKIAFERGPIVYCAEEVDNKNLSKMSVPSDLSLQNKRQSIAGQSVTVLTGKIKQDDLTLIPYYMWSNRGVNTMKVWLPVEN